MKKKAYHGSNVRFSQFEQSKSRVQNDLYGGGVAYFASDIEIAKAYARSMNRSKGGEVVVYEVELTMDSTFDVDDVYTGKTLIEMVGSDQERFARAAGLLKYGSDRLDVLSKLRTGRAELTGDVVFKGMSNGMTRTKDARERLIKLGYDSLRYNGGLVVGANRHDVFLIYDPKQIEIKNRYIVVKEPVSSKEQQDKYQFIN